MKDAFIMLEYKGAIYTVVLDAEDYEKYKHINWSVTNKSRHSTSPKLYVRHNTRRRKEGKQVSVSLHRLIAGATSPEVVVDHDDGNTFNCRRVNLVCTTVAVNARKQKHYQERRANGHFGAIQKSKH